MISSFIVMYVLFPVAILYKIKFYPRLQYNESVFSRSETNIIKGIAALMVVFAHYTSWLETRGVLFPVLYPFTNLGPLGVALFFFVSGYGLTVSNGIKTQKVSFLIKRVLNIYIPYLLVRAILYPFTGVKFTGIDLVGYLAGVVYPDWFVVVIMLLYLIYYFVGYLKENRLQWLTFFVMVLSVILYVICGVENGYWYQGNVCFIYGIVYASYYDKINSFVQRRNLLCLSSFAVAFIVVVAFELSTKGLGKILLVALADILFCTLCVVLLQKIKLKAPIMEYLGAYSLYIYIIHLNLNRIFINFGINYGEISSIVYFIISIGLSVVVKKIIDRFINKLSIYLVK